MEDKRTREELLAEIARLKAAPTSNRGPVRVYPSENGNLCIGNLPGSSVTYPVTFRVAQLPAMHLALVEADKMAADHPEWFSQGKDTPPVAPVAKSARADAVVTIA